MEQKTFIITPVYNQESFTKAYINDLAYLDNNHYIVIVDNGSSAKSKSSIIDLLGVLKTSAKFIYLTDFDKNRGFSVGSNYGYSYATKELGGNNNDIYIFLNNDIRVKKDYRESWTNIIREQIYDNNLVGPTGGLVDEKNDYAFIYETEDMSKKINYMSGWCLGAKGVIYDKLADRLKFNKFYGPFSEKTFAYFEDTYMGFEAKKLGIDFSIIKLPLVHFKRTTSKTMNLSDLYLSSKKIFLKEIRKGV